MKFVFKNMIDIASYQTLEDVEQACFVSHPNKKHIPSKACYNVFWWNKTNKFMPPICNHVLSYYQSVKENETLQKATEATVRVYKSVRSATAFFILPDTLLSNEHVSEIFVSNGSPSIYSDAWSAEEEINPERDIDLIIKESFRKVTRISKQWKGVDPILGFEGDFGYFDMECFKFENKISRNQKVIFVPSPKVLNIGDKFVNMSYPGHAKVENAYQGHQSYEKWCPQPEFLKHNIFNGYGKLCASVGHILAPYSLDSHTGEWKEDATFQYNIGNQEIITSNECVTFGSSGAPILPFKPEIVQCNGYTFIEFVSVHVGGEFVNCKNCLSQSKLFLGNNPRIEVDSSTWGFCSECTLNGSNPQRGYGYNHSLSVHSAPFVQFYKESVLPELLPLMDGNLECIPFLNQYCLLHNLSQ